MWVPSDYSKQNYLLMKIIIDKELVQKLKDWFKNYVGTFKNNNDELQTTIIIKEEHTERVIEEIIDLSKELGLDTHEIHLAEIIALFHDIGRFEQYYRYKTFSDHKSVNHAELGIKILKEHNVLGELDEELQKLIFCSIKNHNLPALPDSEEDVCLFYSRLIRDADKLDIWRVVTDYYNRNDREINSALVLELPDTPEISRSVYEALINKHIVNIMHVNNVNDIKLLQAGLIYDINFKPTLDCVKKRGYIELLRKSLPETNKIARIFNTINNYIETHNECLSKFIRAR